MIQFRATDLNSIEISTLDCLIETFKHNLATIVIGGVKTDLLSDWCQCRNRLWPDVIEGRKYYHQAYHYLKIGAFATETVPKFLISMQDIESSLLKELAGLDNDDRNYVLKQAAGRIFEDINSRLYHISISKLLEVELVD